MAHICARIGRAITPPTSMKLDSGTRLGPYEIVSRIGAGGMGEVDRITPGAFGPLTVVLNWTADLEQR